MTITALPTPPTRSDPTNFSTRADEFLGALPNFATEANALSAEMNGLVMGISDDVNAAANSASAAALSALAAETSEDSAAAVLNFKGAWSNLTGALNVPSTVSHIGRVWMLLNNLANVTTSVPGTDTANWLAVFTPKKPDIKPSLSVDWTLKPTAAALTAAGWTVTRTGEITSFGMPVKAAENLFVRSQDLTNSGSWAASASAVSAVTDETGLVGVTLVADATSINHGLYQTTTNTNIGSANYRVRFLCKAAGYTKCAIGDLSQSRAGAAFDLNTGATIGTGSGAGYVSHSITAHPLGSGLYWCELVMTSVAAGTTWRPIVTGYPDAGATLGGAGALFTGDGTSGIEVYAAQLQQGFDGDYIPTTDAPIALYEPQLVTTVANELAYQHDANCECIGLVQYPGDTNLILQSQNFGTSWTATGLSVVQSKRMWAGNVPFWRLARTDTTSARSATQSVSGSWTAGTKLTLTVALLGDRWSNGTSLSLGVRDQTNASWGAAGTAEPVIISGPGSIVTDTGRRCIVTGLSFDTPTLVRIANTMDLTTTSVGVYFYPGSAGSTTLGAAILATRVHLSASPRLMPYIPTTTAAVTRGRQTLTFGGSAFAAASNPAQGTLLVKASVEDLSFDVTKYLVTLQTGTTITSPNRLAIASNSATAQMQAFNSAFGVTQASDTNIGLISATPQTIAYSFANNAFTPAMNGVVDTTDTAGIAPVVDKLLIGWDTSLDGAYLIQRTELYPRAMTSAELSAITAQGVL